MSRDSTRRAAFVTSPFFPATVLALILTATAALFVGSYTTFLAAPVPHAIPLAIVAPAETGRPFDQALDALLGGALQRIPMPDRAAAREAVLEQRVFGVLEYRGDDAARLQLSGASGPSVAQLLSEQAPRAAAQTGIRIEVSDLTPLQRRDPRGLAIFYMTLAAVIIGFIGAMLYDVHARRLHPGERLAFLALTAGSGGLAITTVVDRVVGALDLPFLSSWAILSLTMFAAEVACTMFGTLFGRWGMLPTWAIMVLLGNPSSGGTVSPALLPATLGTVGQWLPPGASISAHHTALYFPGHQKAFPYLVLIGWGLVAGLVFWAFRHRHPGGREKSSAR
ncbi:hypothetical protein AB0P21_26885 [Kribbella sp. NPDC056861]|uniref:hypothetical protein n=1 Tax=Kribbella sp. NPDC056861 TaxID=3154857 RepID=UPI003429BCCF